MTSRALIAVLLPSLLLLNGCSTFNDKELGVIRGSGVSPGVYHKMEVGRVLRPQDIIELTRRHVASHYIVRQLEDVGIDYLLTPEDHKRLKQARVSPEVMGAVIAASNEFSERYAAPRPRGYYIGPDPYYYGPGPYYDDPYDYGYGYGPYPSRIGGGVTIGYSTYRGRYRHW